MSHAINDYVGSGAIEVLRAGWNRWVRAYNSTGSAISNGKVVRLEFVADTTPAPDCVRCEISNAVVTNTAAGEIVGVVDNGLDGASTIPDATYGWVCVAGQVEAYGGATVSAGQQIEIIAGEDEFKDAGAAELNTARVIEAAGVCIDALADGSLSTVFLFGYKVATKGS